MQKLCYDLFLPPDLDLTSLCCRLLQVRRLNMYNTRAKRNKQGKIIHEVRMPIWVLQWWIGQP